MMIQGKILSYGDDLAEVFRIRREVLVEEFGVSEEIEFDGLDEHAMHVIVYEEDNRKNLSGELSKEKKAVATGRIVYDGISCEIGHIAVLKEFRGKKYGDFTVRMLLNKAFTGGINEVVVNIDPILEKFYQKIGFKRVSSSNKEEFSQFKMIIHPGDAVSLCSKTVKFN